MKGIIATCALLACTGAAMAQTPKLNANNIDEVIKAMTLQEKIELCVGTHRASDTSQGGKYADIVAGVAGATIGIPRLGIPYTLLADGPAGLRINPTRPYDSNTYYCTHFPIGTCLSSSWNTDLVTSVGSAIGDEVHRYGVDVLLAPGVCIHRNPLCGRNFEYYSEDPVLSGNIAAAYINGVQSQGVGTSIKHFAFNNQETQRLGNDAIVSQRAAREIYLKNFEIAIKKAQPWTVMSSYNLVNGKMTSERRDLLTTILRDEWGYKGMVMTDWGGGRDPIRRPHPGNVGLSAFNGIPDRAANMYAGNDLIEPGGEDDIEDIEKAVKSGKLDIKYIDENVKRILQYIVKTPHFKGYQYKNDPDLKAHALVTRNAAAEGTVLLENKGVLPLSPDIKTVALYGVAAYRPIAGGTGSGDVNRRYTVSLVEGMRNAGYTVDNSMIDTYTKQLSDHDAAVAKMNIPWWMPKPLASEVVPSDENIQKAAQNDDVAIVTLQRLSGEGSDRTAKDFNLNDTELQLLNKVTNAFHAQGKKVVVVLNIGGVIESASWKNIPDAILLPWQCGQEFGNSVAELLSGKLTPSGKLPMTWPIAYQDAASSKNFPSDGKGSDIMGDMSKWKDVKNVGYTLYDEDIYVGYRYFDTFDKTVSYPFGYGLSYTTFSYNDVKAADNSSNISVSVTVTNTGNRPGKEVAEVYVTAPKGAIEKPAQELKAFAKTRTLQPGESQTLTMNIDKADLASFNTKQSAWVADGGSYTFKVGASSRDIKGTATLNIKGSKQKVHNVLKPTIKLDLLTQK
jgi:beta-glucosidase